MPQYFRFGLAPGATHSFEYCRPNLGQEGGPHNGGGEKEGSTATSIDSREVGHLLH